MTNSPRKSPGDRFRVSVEDAHLEFLMDGEGDWFATLLGAVETSDHVAVRVGLPIEIRLGDFDPTVWGLHVAPQTASATAAGGPGIIEPLKALITQTREQGPSLKADIRVNGEPEERAGGRAFAWSVCRIFPLLSNTPTMPSDSGQTPEFDADIRVAVTPNSLAAAQSGNPFRLAGPIVRSRHEALPEGMPLDLQLAREAQPGFLAYGDRAEVAWPLRGEDERGVLEALELARDHRAFLDFDLGSKPDGKDPQLWYITDVGLLIPSVLATRDSSSDSLPSA